MAIESFPDVARDAAGNFVVVWSSSHEGGGFGIFGQRFAAPRHRRVKTQTAHGQRYNTILPVELMHFRRE